MELKLYNYFRSSPSFRVRIALHLKGLEFEYIPVHLLNNGGEQHSLEYQKINPAREVPALWHEGAIISQSVAIIEYLDEAFPNPPLYPKEPHMRARVRQLCEIINCTHPLQNLKVLQFLEKELDVKEPKKIQWLTQWMQTGFQAYEDSVKPTAGQFSVGDQVTAADLFLVPQVLAAKRFNIDTTRYKLISRIDEACSNVEAFRKAHPTRQIDTPPELRQP